MLKSGVTVRHEYVAGWTALDEKIARQRLCLGGISRPATFRLSEIPDEASFRKWLEYCEVENSENLRDLDKTEFYAFINTAECLSLEGPMLECFVANMAAKGLIGWLPSDTVDCYSEMDIEHESGIFCKLFTAFIRKARLSLTLEDDSSNASVCGGLSSGRCRVGILGFKEIYKMLVGHEDLNQSAAINMLSGITFANVSVRFSSEFGVSSLGIRGKLDITEATNWYKAFDGSKYQEGGSAGGPGDAKFAIVDSADSMALRNILEHMGRCHSQLDIEFIPGEIYIRARNSSTEPRTVQISGEIPQQSYLEAIFMAWPMMEKLQIDPRMVLDIAMADKFRSLVALKELVGVGARQTDAFVKALVPNIHGLRTLEIHVEKLNAEAIELLANMKDLQVLRIYGCRQSADIVCSIASHLPQLSTLAILSERLDEEHAQAFAGCFELSDLELLGEEHSDKFIAAMLSGLPGLIALRAEVGALTIETVALLSCCMDLRMLALSGAMQSSFIIEALFDSVALLRNLEVLHLMCPELRPELGTDFKEHPNLKRLLISGMPQRSTFFERLLPNVRGLEELAIVVLPLDPSLAQCFQGMANLKKLAIYHGPQTAAFIKELVPKLVSLEELEFTASECLDQEVGRAFGSCENLKVLQIHGIDQPIEFCESLVGSIPNIEMLWLCTDAAAFDSRCALRLPSKLKVAKIGDGPLLELYFGHTVSACRHHWGQ